ncbi:hypothetical protein BBJ28_00022694, partial [Nothophytophthora sp. Chile5]
AAQGALTFILVFITGIGDGLAEPVGITWGKHKYKTHSCFSKNKYTRSWEGSACVFLSGMIFPALQYADFASFTQVLLAMLILPPTMAYAEATAPHTMDTPVLMIGFPNREEARAKRGVEAMFLRDNELSRGGGGRKDDRARVLQVAKQQREARSRRKEQDEAARRLQTFVRGRLTARRMRAQIRADFDQKLGDITKLKAILQLPNMPLPYDALFEVSSRVSRILLFYASSAADAERMLQLSSLFADSLAVAPEGIKEPRDDKDQRHWQLRVLIDVCLQVTSKTDNLVLNEVRLLTKLLQAVPPATYAATGVAVSWTKVSESHSMPVVYPEALNDQLQILVKDHYLRSMCSHLLAFTPSALRHPLSTQRPTPMHPEAPTTAVRCPHFLVLLRMMEAKTYDTRVFWTHATWANNLFEKAGLRRRREEDDESGSTADGSRLPNTSTQARYIAANGRRGFDRPSPLSERPTALKMARGGEPFVLENINALACLCGTFLFRWGGDGGKRPSHAMRLLNTLAFYQVDAVGSSSSGEETVMSISLVHMLWIIPELDSSQLIEEVLQGTPRANKLIQSMPYLVPFPDRVKLFQRLVKADKDLHQNDSTSVYRIRIHRGAILEDGLKKLNSIRTNLKKRINVVFVNSAGREEVGIDAGGLFKEFWLDLSTLAFDLQYGLFLTTQDQLLYPNPNSASGHFSRESDHLTLFQFVGRILGKALYEGIVVQPKFAHFFLSKLLHSFNHLNELPSLDPEIFKNLMFLKSYDGDVEDLGLTHTVVKEVFGEQKEIEIIPGGGDVPVTNRNKTRYIHLVANYYLNTQIREQCAAFRVGLSDLIDPRWLQMFNEPELQVLISGKSGQIDVDDLRSNARYIGGYYALDKRIAWLWQALASYTPSEQAAFLRFTTSCQRAPSLGFESLTPQFCVQKIPIRSDDELLPSSSTCFNTLKLPTYSSYKVLRAKLLTSISSGAGFEMT